jgi:4a-hydroxytetrahydrobiopterin dehydratase
MTTSSDDAGNATRPPQPVPDDGVVPGRTFEVAIDANDPVLLRPFWITALNYVELVTDEGAVDLVDPAGLGPTIWFQHVPETKAAKNRLHLDIKVSPTQRAVLVDKLIALGGTVVSSYPRFTVLADPEGNEVCLTDD